MFFKDKINVSRIIGLLLCLIGVLAIISKGKIDLLLNFKFTSGDLWMVGAAIGWAIYSIYLLNWKSNFSLMARFTLIALFGAITLFPFYILEEIYYFKTVFNNNFFFWVLFAAISPGIIAFTLYTKVQKYVGASLAGFTLYIFSIYSAIYGIIIFDEELYYFNTIFNSDFIFWILFAAISPGIIAFTLYTKVQKYVGASLAGFTLYIFSIYTAVYGIILFDEALLKFHYIGAGFVFIGVYLARKIA